MGEPPPIFGSTPTWLQPSSSIELSKVSKVAAPGPLAPPGVSQNVTCVAGAELQVAPNGNGWWLNGWLNGFSRPWRSLIQMDPVADEFQKTTLESELRFWIWSFFGRNLLASRGNRHRSTEGSAGRAAFPMAQQRSDAARVPATPGDDA